MTRFNLAHVVLVLIYLLALAVSFSLGVKSSGWKKGPGFMSRITQSGLDFWKDIGVEATKREITQMDIPDYMGNSGRKYYEVTNMHITSFGIPSSSMTPDARVGGVTFTASDVFLTVKGNWHYKLKNLIPISDSGSFTAQASRIDLRLTIRVGKDAAGRPSVESESSDCLFHVDNMDVHFHGGASWFYNLFDGVIEKKIKTFINDQVCKIVVKMVNTNIEDNLKRMEVVVPLGDDGDIDYSLVARPTFNGSISMAHQGEVYPRGDRTECPLPVPVIPADPDTSRMSFIWITEYLPNSAGYVLQNAGLLQFNLTEDNVPKEERSLLRTSSYILIIPKKYADLGLQINVNSSQPPRVHITPKGIEAVLVGDFSPYVVKEDNQTLEYLFTLNVTIRASVNVAFKDNKLTWALKFLRTDISLIRSAIGKFSLTSIELAINTATNLYFLPMLNEYGTEGASLPQVEGMKFARPVITQGQGFIKIATDIAQVTS